MMKKLLLKHRKSLTKYLSKKEIPDEIDEFHIEENTEINILDLLLLVNFAPSKGEAKKISSARWSFN